MTRKECLEQAMGCVLRDRNNQYGKPEDNFGRIADLWEAYLHAPISALDVAMMMSLLKIARAKANPARADSFVDLAGYAACAAECAGGTHSTSAKPDVEFKFDEKVHALLPGMGWCKGYYVRKMKNGKHSVRLLDGHLYDDVETCHHRNTEGCEELVQGVKDKRKEALLEMRETLLESSPFHAKEEEKN